MPRSIKQSNQIIAVSEFTKAELMSELGIDPQKISVTLLAPSPIERSAPSKPKSLENQPFFLFVGTLEPRKNLKNLLLAFSNYLETDKSKQIVIAGKDGWGNISISQIAKKLNIEENVKILGYVTEEELHYLYQNCEALLMPSLYEGFGLPAIEALHYSKPVIATQNSAITQVLSPLVINTENESPEAIHFALKKLKNLEIKEGEAITLQTWQNCAKQTLDVINRISIDL
ncbi:hypothetical protein GCM10007877_26900 [Marinibactrum halimedae]|uniref:Glycosyl transferase family 1 domain-containing protein n=2 Tax=Marinibactrum halimedae TaxID=1444977 RepID=A0AA37T706_9GAMM|nr:hypothetical protein GCM10007877_26900 [Marinibactrum halimedae]